MRAVVVKNATVAMLEGVVDLPGELQPVVNDLVQRMVLRNAVKLLERIVNARVLAHGGPDGLEIEARRIVRWYADLPADQRDMAMHVGVDFASGPDWTVTR